MKKILMLVSICSLLLMQSCNDFLNVTPRNTKVVESIEDYRAILANYMVYIKTPNPSGSSLLNAPKFDNALITGLYSGETTLELRNGIYDSKLNEYTTYGKGFMGWLASTHFLNPVWNNYYQFLGPVNLVIDGIKTATGDDENMRNYVTGEALVWRAFSYFKLLQYYAPYKDNQYGVPVYLKPYDDPGNAMPPRETQLTVYKQILADCNKALDLLEKTPSTDWNYVYRTDFIHAMLASVYTYKALSGAAEANDWKNAADQATEAMQNRTLSNTPEAIRELFDCSETTGQKAIESDECYIRLIDGKNRTLLDFRNAYRNISGSTYVDGYADLAFYLSYSDEDVRKSVYFKNNNGVIQYNKYNLLAGTENGGVLMPFRLAEMYLIKAEALCRQGNTGEAKIVLDDFRKARYTTPPTASADLLNEILKERRLEFYLENDFAWLEMKRLGKSVTRTINGIPNTLEPDDFRYCYPVPAREMEYNRNMVQIPGWDKMIVQ